MTATVILVAKVLAADVAGIVASVLGADRITVTDRRDLSAGHAVEFTLSAMPVSVMAATEALAAALPGTDIAITRVENRRKRLLVADMDSTIVVGETIDELAAALGKDAEVSAITARAMAGELDFEEALDARVAMLAGLDAAEIDRVAEALDYSPGAAEFVATMARAGDTALVSGGFDRVTGTVRRTLGFAVDIANHLIVGEDGRLTGKPRKPIVDSATKLRVLNERAAAAGLSLGDALTIGDGANDGQMIEAALAAGGLGIAYRGKPTLRARTPYRIDHTDLRSALYFQGYDETEISKS